MTAQATGTSSRGTLKKVGLILGPILAALVYGLLPTAVLDESGTLASGLTHPARAAAAVGVLMATYWLTEAIAIPATAILPAALFPLLGVMSVQDTAARYAQDVLLLFFGGFILGLAMEKHGLHRRIALTIVRIVGASPGRLVAGFMLASAALSGWVSNTATTLMMLPIGMSLISLVLNNKNNDDPESTAELGDSDGQNFATCLMLGIAYAASIGGIITLIGTPPNVFLAGFVDETLGREISMQRWMRMALPLALIFLPLCWLLLTKVIFPIKVSSIGGAADELERERKSLGRMNRGEWIVLVVFLCTALAWVLRPQLNALGERWGIDSIASIRDSSIAITAAILLFVIPTDFKRGAFTMDWRTAERVPWGILILFGGGLALAKGISDTGVDTFIGDQFAVLQGVHPLLIVFAVCATIIFLTEVTSNTAIASAVLPVLAAVAGQLGLDPIRLLVPATIAASLAFMLPVATPPNAIVFGSGRVTIGQMSKAGLWLNFIGILLASLFGYFFADSVLTPIN